MGIEFFVIYLISESSRCCALLSFNAWIAVSRVRCGWSQKLLQMTL